MGIIFKYQDWNRTSLLFPILCIQLLFHSIPLQPPSLLQLGQSPTTFLWTPHDPSTKRGSNLIIAIQWSQSTFTAFLIAELFSQQNHQPVCSPSKPLFESFCLLIYECNFIGSLVSTTLINCLSIILRLFQYLNLSSSRVQNVSMLLRLIPAQLSLASLIYSLCFSIPMSFSFSSHWSCPQPIASNQSKHCMLSFSLRVWLPPFS